MPNTTTEQNKALVLEAFDTLFNKRDYAGAERFWSPQSKSKAPFTPKPRRMVSELCQNDAPSGKRTIERSRHRRDRQ